MRWPLALHARVRRESGAAPPPGKPYPWLQAPAYFTRVAPPLFPDDPDPAELILGGFRVYTDDLLKELSWVDTEIFLARQPDVICTARVAWVDELPDGAPARFDVGLQIAAINPCDRKRLVSVVKAG